MWSSLFWPRFFSLIGPSLRLFLVLHFFEVLRVSPFRWSIRLVANFSLLIWTFLRPPLPFFPSSSTICLSPVPAPEHGLFLPPRCCPFRFFSSSTSSGEFVLSQAVFHRWSLSQYSFRLLFPGGNPLSSPPSNNFLFPSPHKQWILFFKARPPPFSDGGLSFKSPFLTRLVSIGPFLRTSPFPTPHKLPSPSVFKRVIPEFLFFLLFFCLSFFGQNWRPLARSWAANFFSGRLPGKQ